MLKQITKLLVIQDRDSKIKSLQHDLDKIPRDAAAIKQRLVTAMENLAKAKLTMQENEVAIKKIDLDRKVRKTTIERLTTQQFETKKNDEYATLGSEVIRYQDMVDELETQELECMEKSDDLKATQADAESKLSKTKENMAEEVKALTSRKATNSVRIEELKVERAELIKSIDAGLASMYERVFTKKGENAIAPLEGNKCGSCHMKVIADTVSRTINEKEVSQCDNCAAFLYSV